MTIDKATELLTIQAGQASGYNRNSAKLILAEVMKEHGQPAVDQLIRELKPDTILTSYPVKKLLSGSRVQP